MNKTIRLRKEHRHNGIDEPIGAELTMNATLVKWLVGQDVGDEVKTDPTKVTRTPSPPVRRGCCGSWAK